MEKAVFLDRDGVINEEIGDYVYTLDKFKLVSGIVETLQELKERGYRLIVITNQAGIAKGRYGHEQVDELHRYFQEASNAVIDHFYYAFHHPDYTSESFARKPGSLLFEKGLAKFNVDPSQSWMVGDKERDLIPAKKLGMQTVRIWVEGYYTPGEQTISDFSVNGVRDLVKLIH